MPLSIFTLERTARRLWALEQRLELLENALTALCVGAFAVGSQAVPMSAGQKTGLKTLASQLVGAVEQVLATLETEIAGSTTVVPGTPGVGITDFAAGLSALAPLHEADANPQVAVGLAQDIYRSLAVPRDTDGELIEGAINPAGLNTIRSLLIIRFEKMKTAIAQLRAMRA
jgi:hypothetical protein